MNFIAKICAAPSIILFIVLSLFTVSILGQNKIYVDEEVKVQNYADAPIELQMVRTVTRPTDSEEWFDTCFHYSIRNKTGMELYNYSYEIINKDGKAHVQGSSFVTLKPFDFQQSREQCVANSVFEDEGPFVFRLIFIELEHRTLWASDDHKKAVKKMRTEFSGIIEEKEDGN